MSEKIGVKDSLEELISVPFVEAIDMDNNGFNITNIVGMLSGTNGTFVGELVKNFGRVDDSYVSATLSDNAAMFMGERNFVYLKNGKHLNLSSIEGSTFVLDNFDGNISYFSKENEVFHMAIIGKDVKMNIGSNQYNLEAGKLYMFKSGKIVEQCNLTSSPVNSGIIKHPLLGSYAYFGTEKGIIVSRFDKVGAFEMPSNLPSKVRVTTPSEIVKYLKE